MFDEVVLLVLNCFCFINDMFDELCFINGFFFTSCIIQFYFILECCNLHMLDVILGLMMFYNWNLIRKLSVLL